MRNFNFLASTIVFSFGAFSALATEMGVVRYNDVVNSMPEYKAALDEFQQFSKKLDDELQAKSLDLQKKIKDKFSNVKDEKDLTEGQKKELEAIVKEAQSFEKNILDRKESKQKSLMNPIIEKIKSAIKDEVKSRKLDMVIRAEMCEHFESGVDITDVVIKKVGGSKQVISPAKK